jgi:transcriptional regulator with XRE-family HTH domain
MPPSNLGVLLGARLRARREALGWSQAQLAEAVGVTPNYVGVVERGEKLPTLETVEAFGRALGVRIAQLLVEDAPDSWADEAAALASAVPVSHRELVIALLRAVVAEARQRARKPRGYVQPTAHRAHAVSEKPRRRRSRA